jgi:hypothetical protein
VALAEGSYKIRSSAAHQIRSTDSMKPTIAALAAKIRELEDELETRIEERRAELRFTVHERRVRFEEEIRRRHRQIKTRLSRYVLGARPMVVLTAPVIYSIAIPLLLLDLFATAYQAICFPVYGIPKVDRRKYLSFDRRHLAYLNALEKLNCEYCTYANGLIAYLREIAGRTEQYWCPIKHAIRVRSTHTHYRRFVDYGDAKAYRDELERLREELRELEQKAT